MIGIDITNKDYYTQRNNELEPKSSCNVTTMIQALSLLGYQFPKGDYKQPEDNLRDFIIKNGGNPELHTSLSRLTNEWMGSKVTYFNVQVPVSIIFDDLRHQIPVVLSGTFYGKYGHLVTLIGFDDDSAYWIDPYGNTLDNWKGSGRIVKVSLQYFNENIKPLGNFRVKWAHRFNVKL